MESSFEKLQELNLSRDEVETIGEALKKEEFRKLLIDYVEELQDPENQKLFEKEIKELEKERGNDVTFLHPKPCYVIKTSVDGQQKGFVNICVNENIGKPSSSPTVNAGNRGLQWLLPHSLSPPRDDLDNKNARCKVFDVLFHPDTLHLASKNNAFRDMVNMTALEAVEKNFDVNLDKKNLKFPKLSYKGVPRACISTKSTGKKPVEQSPEEKELYDKIYSQLPTKSYKNNNTPKKTKATRRNSTEENSVYTTPKYIIKHRRHIEMQEFTEHKGAKINVTVPKELVVEINLPLLKSSGDMDLDVTQRTVQLTSETPAKYKLNLTLPYQVNEAAGSAKFDKDLKKLVITLPVKQKNIHLYDSGVESDINPGSPESEEEVGDKTVVSEIEHYEPSAEPSNEYRTNHVVKNCIEESVYYSLPEFSCHVFDNVAVFTLNVKNVDESSVTKKFAPDSMSLSVKFASVSPSFYISNYAFCVKFPSHKIDEENVTIETWDNNVVLQVHLVCDTSLKSYFYGINEENLSEKFVDETTIKSNMVPEEAVDLTNTTKADTLEENPAEGNNNNLQSERHEKLSEIANYKRKSEAINIMATSYESSGDELSCSSFSPRKSKGILKRLSSKRTVLGRSISESSLDDFVCSSIENCHQSVDFEIPEDEELSTSLKKTVRFNDVVTRQLFRSNSSILGQKKKNQRKSRNKKRAHERRHSESEASDMENRKEGDHETNKEETSEGNDIFQLEINN